MRFFLFLGHNSTMPKKNMGLSKALLRALSDGQLHTVYSHLRAIQGRGNAPRSTKELLALSTNILSRLAALTLELVPTIDPSGLVTLRTQRVAARWLHTIENNPCLSQARTACLFFASFAPGIRAPNFPVQWWKWRKDQRRIERQVAQHTAPAWN